MPRYKDDPTAVCVYTVCDESRYLFVRNVPALGCGDDLLKLFANYGDVEECKPMDAEDCDIGSNFDSSAMPVKQIGNHFPCRFAKRKSGEFVFLGNHLQVSYAPQFESLDDTKDKLECRRKEILARLNPQRSKEHPVNRLLSSNETPSLSVSSHQIPDQINCKMRNFGDSEYQSHSNSAPITRVSSDKIAELLSGLLPQPVNEPDS